MQRLNTVLLMSKDSGKHAQYLAMEAGIRLDVSIVDNLDALEAAFSTRRDLLLSFGTGVIVPTWILEKPELLALNVHAASPQYPGRDPHHFAIYDGATQYGATMHYMTKNVDAGPIVDVELFDVQPDSTPFDLLNAANKAGWILIKRFFERYDEYGAPKSITDVSWSGYKSTRKMFQELCRIDARMPKVEIERRYKASAMLGYRNLYIDIHGYRFRIEGLALCE